MTGMQLTMAATCDVQPCNQIECGAVDLLLFLPCRCTFLPLRSWNYDFAGEWGTDKTGCSDRLCDANDAHTSTPDERSTLF
jgi:hypothetical protein